MLKHLSIRRDLTPRELQVCLLITGESLLSKQIAARLGISTSSVDKHLASIFKKFRIRSRMELVNGYWKDRMRGINWAKLTG